MSALIVLDKLDKDSAAAQQEELAGDTHAAIISPAASLVLGESWRLPSPGPVKRHRGTPFGRVVAHQLDICIFVEVRIGMELPSDKILDLTLVRRIHERETVDLGVSYWARLGAIWWLGAPDDEGKGKDEVVLVGELQEECRSSTSGGIWVLNKLDGRVVTEGSRC